MAGLKATSSAVSKNPIPRTSKSSKANNSSLSAELVGDSDDDGEEVSRKQKKHDVKADRSKLTATKPVAAKLNGLRPEQDTKRQTPKPAPTKNVAQNNGTVKDSQDYTTAEEDSDAGSSSQNSAPSPIKHTSAPPRVAQAKTPKYPVSNGPSLITKTKPSTPHTDKRNATDGKRKISGEDDSAGGSENSSGDESVEGFTGSEKSLAETPRKSSPARQPAEEPAPPPYEPPSGFKSAPVSLHPSSRLSELLASSDLRGKEIWHITVPASVPVATIKEVSPKSIQTGESILLYKGAEYGLVLESGAEASNCKLLLPSSETKDYQLSTLPAVKTLHLQQLVKLPSRAIQVPDIRDPASKPKTHVKTVRQQPEGLKMRYHAFGAPESSDSDGSGEDAVQAHQFRVPDIPARASKKRKLSNDVPDNAEAYSAPNKKQKALNGHSAKAQELPIDAVGSLHGSAEENSQRSVSSNMKNHGTPLNGSNSDTRHKPKKDGGQLKNKSTPTASQSILPQDLTKEAQTIMPEEVVNIDTGIDKTLPEEDPKVLKARRKKGKLERHETEKANTYKIAERPPTNSNGSSQHRPKSHSLSQSRESSMPPPTPNYSSRQNGAATAKKSPADPKDSAQSSQNQASKEEKAKRKAEKKQKKTSSDV